MSLAVLLLLSCNCGTTAENQSIQNYLDHVLNFQLSEFEDSIDFGRPWGYGSYEEHLFCFVPFRQLWIALLGAFLHHVDSWSSNAVSVNSLLKYSFQRAWLNIVLGCLPQLL